MSSKLVFLLLCLLLSFFLVHHSQLFCSAIVVIFLDGMSSISVYDLYPVLLFILFSIASVYFALTATTCSALMLIGGGINCAQNDILFCLGQYCSHIKPSTTPIMIKIETQLCEFRSHVIHQFVAIFHRGSRMLCASI